MKRKVFQYLIIRYLNQDATPKESTLLDSWYDSFPSEQEKLLSAERMELMEQELILRIRSLKQRQIEKTKRRCLQWSAGIAASLLLFMGFYLLRHPDSVPSFSKSNPEEAMVQYFESAVGQRSRIDLPDGSQLTLYPRSKVAIDLKEYQAGNRKVQLLFGEVFFEVQKVNNQPFTVYSDSLQTHVLGTSFLIRSYPELQNQQLQVYSGRVMLRLGNRDIALLEKGKGLVYHKNQQTFEVAAMQLEDLHARNFGVYQLKQVTFPELALYIHNLYGLQISTESKQIEKQRYSLPLKKEIPIHKLLKVISSLHNNAYRQEGGQVIFY